MSYPVIGESETQLINGRWYKRDDLPHYPNGVNGKIRTARYLAETAQLLGATRLVYGGSVVAPALGRVASTARAVGMDCTLVVGSDPDKAVRHPEVRVAVEAGAELVRAPIAYNPGLQKRVRELVADSDGTWSVVPYGISTGDGWSPEQVRAFLGCDAPQVDTIPPEITDLVMAFGSGNAAAGVLYGLATRGRTDITCHLVGVGPDKSSWLRTHLARAGVNIGDLQINYLPLHPHFAEYKDLMPAEVDGINLHPRYEGKVAHFLNALAPSWWTRREGTTCFWIVGGPIA